LRERERVYEVADAPAGRPALDDRCRRDVGDRGGDGACAGEARREAGASRAEPQGGGGGPGACRRRVPERRRHRAAARPQLAGVRAPLRRALPRARPAAQPPHVRTVLYDQLFSLANNTHMYVCILTCVVGFGCLLTATTPASTPTASPCPRTASR
jgi:hypothetical protein